MFCLRAACLDKQLVWPSKEDNKGLREERRELERKEISFSLNPKMSVTVASLDAEIAKKYQQLSHLSIMPILTFLVENKQSKEVCVLKCANKRTTWPIEPDKQNKLVNVRHNNLAKIIEIKETNEHYFVVEELCVTTFCLHCQSLKI